jgi:4-diphosphocytidyl-2C-methyl-D-erythritol kinase
MYAEGAELSLMTGTGSTVFGIFKELEQAKRLQEFFDTKKYFTFLESPSFNG